MFMKLPILAIDNQGKPNLRGGRFWLAGLMALVMAWTGCVSKPRADAGNAVEADNEAGREARDDVFEQLHLLTEAMMYIRRGYIDEEKTDYQALIHGALRGMLTSLDPYSQFLDQEDHRALREDAAGEFGGIGITIGIRDNVLTVIAPMEDTPAFRAGILAGDRIVEIDGRKTDGKTLAEAVRELRGEVGEPVTLRVMRDEHRELKTFTLERDMIRVVSVRGARMLDGGIGYVRLVKFSENTADGLRQQVDGLLEKGMQGLVLDLRGNSGGLLSSAIEVSRQFLSPGDLIVTTRGRGDRMIGNPVKAVGRDYFSELPLVVLVNSGTASAAEIVAGSLQDNRRAVLVGETTFGKGSVQSVLPLEQETAIRLTTARYFTPSERVIHGNGIEPDIEVSMSADEWRRVQMKRLHEENPELARDEAFAIDDPSDVVDRQLERAMDLLKALVIFHGNR